MHGIRLFVAMATMVVVTAVWATDGKPSTPPVPTSSESGWDAERAILARLSNELRALEPLIREAEGNAVHGERSRFEYGWLRRDLHRIIDGINDHLYAPRVAPHMPPLRGDYRR